MCRRCNDIEFTNYIRANSDESSECANSNRLDWIVRDFKRLEKETVSSDATQLAFEEACW